MDQLGLVGKYTVRILTRSATSTSVGKQVAALPNVEIVLGNTYDEDTLRKAFQGVDYAFVNTNSFVLGISAETYWGIRIFEIAIESGVQHFIWSTLEYALRESGYNEDFRVVHYEGKSRVMEWMKSQPQSPMRWSAITSGPYIEMLSELMRPIKDQDGVYVFRAPLKDGAIPFVHLDDFGNYARWTFEHPQESTGMNIKTSVEHVGFDYLAKTFTEVTGKPARYENISLEEYFTTGPMAYRADAKLGAQTQSADDPTLLSNRESFSGWWRLYQNSGNNQGLIRTDYALLDRILPERISSLAQWMRKVDYDGEPRAVLKIFQLEALHHQGEQAQATHNL